MNNQFYELTKNMAQSVTRRAALQKLGLGLAGMALACFGLANKACAGNCKHYLEPCTQDQQCCSGRCEKNLIGGKGAEKKGYCGGYGT